MQVEGSPPPNPVDRRECGSEMNGINMESPTVTSLDGLSSLDSGKSVEVTTRHTSSLNSAQSEPLMKAYDYIGLAIETFSGDTRTEPAPTPQHGGHPEIVMAESRVDLNHFQETELRLGPPESGSSFQFNKSEAPASLDAKTGDLLLLKAVSRRQGMANVHTSLQRDTWSETLKNRFSLENDKALDLGMGFSCQMLPFTQEEVGENKVSSLCGRHILKRSLDCQEQLSEQQEIPSHHQVMAVSDAFEEEQKLLPLITATGHSLQDPQSSKSQQLTSPRASEIAPFSRPAVPALQERGLSQLQELSAAHRFWHARMMLRAADTNCLSINCELPSAHTQDPEAKPAGGFGSPLSSNATAVRGCLNTPRSTVAGAKRVFSEAITEGAVMLNGAAKVANSGVSNVLDLESKVFNQHQQPFSWSSVLRHPHTGWPGGFDGSNTATAAFVPTASTKALVKSELSGPPSKYSFHVPSPESSSASAQKNPPVPANGMQQESQAAANEETKDATPRGPVGWPPVQSFRKNSLPPPKPKSNLERKQSPAILLTPAATPVLNKPKCHFVKVYMDGLPFGRKVDLRIHDNYEKLSMVLEEMFKGFINVQCGSKESEGSSTEKQLKFLSGSEYVITYEDKDGDLMLVGDVPWQMFIAAVRRLRIMKGSEAIGIAPRLAGSAKCT